MIAAGRCPGLAVDGMPGLLQVLDPHGRLIGASERWISRMGYGHVSRVIGRRLTGFMDASSAQRHAALWPTLPGRGGFDDEPATLIRADGEPVAFLLSARVRRGRDGRLRQVVLDCVDLDRRAAGRIAFLEQTVHRLQAALGERERADRQALVAANQDHLTGLANRALLHERLDRMLAASAACGGFAVLFLDLDRFKNVNDSLGHHFGDRLLCEVGRRLRQAVREIDLVARLGGDEFIVVRTGESGAAQTGLLARRLIDQLSRPFGIDGRQVRIGASIGVAMAPRDGRARDMLLRKADAALYQVKARGGGDVMFFQGGSAGRWQERGAPAGRPANDARIVCTNHGERFGHHRPRGSACV